MGFLLRIFEQTETSFYRHTISNPHQVDNLFITTAMGLDLESELMQSI